MKPITMIILLIADLFIIGVGLMLQFGVIATQTPPNATYFVGPYLLLLTLLIAFRKKCKDKKAAGKRLI